MRTAIYLREDIANVLRAADKSTVTLFAAFIGQIEPSEIENVKAYFEGYRVALVEVAMSFGINPRVILSGSSSVCNSREASPPYQQPPHKLSSGVSDSHSLDTEDL